MTLKTRKILSLFFIIAFFVITPLIILYALGYNINLSWPIKFNHALQKTGMLIIDTKPQGARIILNGQDYAGFFDKFTSKKNFTLSPAKIKNLRPGEYTVRLELDGYWPWEKRLVINPGSSTFAEDVVLFKKNLPLLTAEKKDLKMLSYSNNKKNVALGTKNNLELYSLDEEKFIYATTTQITSVEKALWSNDDQKILWGNTIFILSSELKKINLEKIIGVGLEKIKWSEDSNTIYYLSKNSLYAYSLIDGKNTSIYLANGEIITDYLKADDYLYVLSRTNKTVSLKIINFKNNLVIREIGLPNSTGYQISSSQKNILDVFNNDKKILYLINPTLTDNPLITTINNIKKYSWINKQKLLYANDFEIWTINIESGETELLTRISYPITDLIWHNSNNYIIYSTNKAIYSLELDVRDRHNITELIKLDNVTNLFLNNDASAIYFNGQINQKTGLYKLGI